jgi:hypothetical protein
MTTGSEKHDRASRIITFIMRVLDENHMCTQIDTAIQRVAGRFECRLCPPVTSRSLHRIVGRFVQLVYAEGLRVPILLAPADALAEALVMLESAYQSPTGDNGYDAAVLDARLYGDGAMASILECLADTIRLSERDKHVRGTIATCLKNLDRQTLDDVGRAVRDQLAGSLPLDAPSLTAPSTPDAILNGIRQLMRADHRTQGYLDAM